MDYLTPMTDRYTIYTRSGCSYCTMAIELLKNETPQIDEVCCDEYITDTVLPKNIAKYNFFQFIQNITGVKHQTFPVVFYKGKFIGGYTETLKQLR